MPDQGGSSEAVWLKILDAVNYEIMRNNEYEMGLSKALVDFENMGRFPERIGGLFSALQEGLKEIDVTTLAVTLLVLPYKTQTDKFTDPLLVIWSPEKSGAGARWAAKFTGDDRRACQRSVEEARREANLQGGEGDVHIVQVPYFVRPFAGQSKEELDVEQLIHKTPRVFGGGERESDWVCAYPASQYVQRFLFTVVCRASAEKIQGIFFAEEGAYLSHLLGAFFSWVGIAADEVTRFQVERVASFQLLRAHQLGNELKALFNFERQNLKIMEQAGPNPTGETVRRIRAVLRAWRRILTDLTSKMAEFSQVASTVGAQRAEFNWHAEFLRSLETFGASPSGDTKYSVEGAGKWQTASEFDLSGVAAEAKNAYISYSRYHFPELIENLYKNAKRAWERQDNTGRQQFRVTARIINSHMELSFANEGHPIEEPLKSKLFRQPVPSEATGGNGTGLWALGMSLQTFGLPLPRVENIGGFGPCFIFCFPAKVKD